MNTLFFKLQLFAAGLADLAGNGLIESLIYLLVAALVLLIIFFVSKKFFPAEFLSIVGLILGLVFLLVALRVFKFL